MNKIRSIHQLKAEKKRLQEKQELLEQKIRGHWSALKAAIKPGKGGFSSTDDTGDKKSESLFKQTLNYGFSLLARKASDIAGKKLENVLRKKF